MTRWGLRSAAAALALGLVGCGGGQSAVCDSSDQLQRSVEDLRDLSISADGVDAIQEKVATVEQDVQDLLQDASDEYGDQVRMIDDDVKELTAVVRTAKDSTNATALAAVRPALKTLANDVRSLVDDVKDTCRPAGNRAEGTAAAGSSP